MHALLCAAVFTLTWLLVPATSSAAPLEFAPCPGTPDYECASFDAPLDPAGREPGTVRLAARRLIETRDAPAVLVALAGGPGQSSTRYIADFADVLAEGLENRQLVVLDPRGTGDSGALRCEALEGTSPAATASDLIPRVGRCGEQLGDRRRFYTTTEAVEDLDVLRRGLGVERIAIFGVSYGTYVAQRYARRYPENVDRLVLDSSVAQDQGGPFDRSSYAAIPRALERVCAHGACRGVTRDPAGDIRRLAARLARRPLRARVYDHRGRGRSFALRGEPDLFDLLVSSDLSPTLREELPGAVRAALAGDAAPLVRLVAADAGSADPREFDEENDASQEFSNALFFATTCQEKPLPWGSAEAPLGERRSRREEAIAALGPRAFAPFGPGAVASTQVGTAFCERWPVTRIAPVPAPGPIGAPALLLSGMTDLRTPPSEALAAAALFSDASLVRVPGAGHSLVSSRLRCVQTALGRFFASRSVGNPCAGETPRALVPHPAPRPPANLRQVPRLGVRGRGGPTLAAVLATLRDASRSASALGPLDGVFRFGGLRGGSACAVPGEANASGARATELVLRRAAYVPGVLITGRAVLGGRRLRSMRITVRGRAVPRGRMRLAGRRLRGRLAGERVRMRIPTKALAVRPVPHAPSLRGGRCR